MKKKTIYTQLLKLFITCAVIGWIIYSYGWSNIKITVLQARINWLLGGVLLFVLSIVLGARQWQIILKNKRLLLPFGKALRLYFTGIFFNNFILGIVAGDAFKVATLHLDKKGGKAGFAASFIDRLAGLFVLSLYAIIGGTIIFILNIQQNKQFYMVLGVLALFVAIIVGFFIILLSQRLQNALRDLMQKLPKLPARELILNVLDETFINRRLREDKKMLAQIAVISLFIQTLRIIVNIFAAQSLGIFSFATMHYFFVIIPIITLLMIVPTPFGVRETIGGVIFGLAGFSVEESVIMLFLATIVCVTASLVGGIMFLFNRKVEREKAPAQSVG